ncbi:GNAT family N-acetyltransferase [Streptomyces sp. NPDC054854]
MDLHLVTVLSCWEGDVVGFANVHTASWEVETLYVAPARRRRGVARALLKAVDRWAAGTTEVGTGSGLGCPCPLPPLRCSPSWGFPRLRTASRNWPSR